MFQSFVPKLRPGRERLVDVVRVENDVGAHAHAGDQRPAQRVGAVELDDVERIDAVAERLGHLAMLRVARRAVQIHGVIRRARP